MPRPAPLRAAAVLAAAAIAGAALAAEVPERWKRAWPDTDFTQMTVPPSEIISGGPPKDGIPAVDDPTMIPAGEETRLDPREPVMVVAFEGEPARAYPIRYLMWHEIANDTVAGVPIAVTFCPLCNSALVFDGRLDGQVLDFGVSGMLRHSDMVMFDRQTESWWQQFNGTGIAGAYAGRTLDQIPSLMLSWREYREEHPRGLVMAEPEGYRRPYGRNPYAGYDSGVPFLYRGEEPPHGIDPVARVVRVGDRAWPLGRVAEKGEIEEAGVRISWTAGQASALDTGVIGEGRDVGTIRVVDAGTGRLVPHEVTFAFAFHAFEPAGTWMIGDWRPPS